MDKNWKYGSPTEYPFLQYNLKENGIEWIAYNEKYITYSKLDLPTKFHPNQTKIAKVCLWAGNIKVWALIIFPHLC